MFVASYHNTMASARFAVVVREQSKTVEEMRRERSLAQAAELKAMTEKCVLQQQTQHEREIAIARELIAKGRSAARRVNSGADDTYRFSRICERLCRAFNVSMHEVCSDRRNREVVICRQAIIYWTIRRTRFSFPYIGRAIGGRDHTTCLHATRAYPAKRAKMGRYLRAAR